MIRKGLLLAALAAGLTVWATVAQASGRHQAKVPHSIRQYLVTFAGHESFAFDASAGSSPVGCAYSEKGDMTVYWRDRWRVTVTVYPRSRHVLIETIEHLGGSSDPKHSGDSEIQGTNSNPAGTTTCSSQGRAGAFDSTSEDILPSGGDEEDWGLVLTRDGKAYEFSVDGFATLRGVYDGQAPSGDSCAGDLGSNASPGGVAVGSLLAGSSTVTRSLLTDSTIIALAKHHSLRAAALSKTRGRAWADPFPKPGSKCALPGSNQKCTWNTPLRRTATLTIKRTH